MGLKSFLKEQGFIEESAGEKKKDKTTITGSSSGVEPTYFPVSAASAAGNPATVSGDPAFVAPLQKAVSNMNEQPDASFVKFFEDELVKANLPGPDYFEFRQLLIKTQQKMAAKGVVAPEVVLQAVMMSFEAQDVTTVKLVDAARHYKDVLKQKNDDFLKGAASEKNNQLQKRQNVLQGREDNIKKIQQQLQQLELQKQQLDEAMNKEKMQMDADKSMGKEGIEKIEKAERLIAAAHAFMQTAIDTDIKRLQTV
ncbi:MAG TPA: hypothetical protein VK645_09965 [Chitinophagaceae bacterium]|nr:hypothetical protein [Chitinophagaceae bacterium]